MWRGSMRSCTPNLPRRGAAERLEQLLKRRARVVQMQAGLPQTWQGVAGVEAELTAVATAYACLLKRIDTLMEQAMKELPEVATDARQVRAIPGYARSG